MTGVLVLTMQGLFHRIVNERRALDLMRRGRAVRVQKVDAPPVRWARGAVARPSVVYLTRHVPHIPHGPRPTRRAVLERDRHTRVYCGRPGHTIDHVHPVWLCRAQGWRAVVPQSAGDNSRRPLAQRVKSQPAHRGRATSTRAMQSVSPAKP